ncbi:helix-turn-helix transcriptional regulator [Oceanicaulis sp. UBA2681]|uniref:helix-turn-helix domain-containing protein n=1 Tax=Oceanicaulis sp. UBA2681 TaxID=1947007 RepID=UPI000ECCF89C|nr:XRE family transcriptional regulator [Oceanicaulis sp.]|tara:strand:- start:15029 stop:15241 length:213 start_codon:yes stop_codon:yes gene_type:complete
MELRHVLALNIQRLRRERGFSQEAFADHAGMDRTYISGIERGVRNPTVGVLSRLATALDVEPWQLLKPRG